jgi:hypothetical protein
MRAFLENSDGPLTMTWFATRPGVIVLNHRTITRNLWEERPYGYKPGWQCVISRASKTLKLLNQSGEVIVTNNLYYSEQNGSQGLIYVPGCHIKDDDSWSVEKPLLDRKRPRDEEEEVDAFQQAYNFLAKPLDSILFQAVWKAFDKHCQTCRRNGPLEYARVVTVVFLKMYSDIVLLVEGRPLVKDFCFIMWSDPEVDSVYVPFRNFFSFTWKCSVSEFIDKELKKDEWMKRSCDEINSLFEKVVVAGLINSTNPNEPKVISFDELLTKKI